MKKHLNRDEFIHPLKIYFQPQEDITPYELALCLKLILRGMSHPLFAPDIDLNESYVRHFILVENKNNSAS